MSQYRIFTDPTYLRTIHDGLLSGTMHKDNSSALPMGLVGLYEEALPPVVNVNERKKFIEFFSIWALLKKEVSAEFVLPLLEGLTEEEVIDYIAKYSKWFNSPVSGKYVLYHERLRTFILQKISAHHFENCNEQIIHQCQLALQAKAGDEWERYALEYLSTHLLIQAIESNDGEALRTLSYNTTHWNRQIEISKGFEWSKRMLNDMMLWASKFDDNEVIECALNKVDLHHLEQNDAPRIAELVAQNNIETALQRIEAFGGNDKEGLQRKFILYMLCLMELTLLYSKDKPFRKEAIEKLLKHLDDNLPVDHSVLNWNDFFPSNLMFQMACKYAEMGLDYYILYKRTDNWENDWLAEKAPYNRLQFKVLMDCARGITYDRTKSSALKDISNELAKQGKVEEALTCAREITYDREKISALKDIITELARQGHVKEALACTRGISDESEKSSALKDISTELAKQGHLEESLACVRGISVESEKSSALKDISTELAKQGYVEAAASAMQDSLACALGISSNYIKSSALKDISMELAIQGYMKESLVCAHGISSEKWRSSALKDISTELFKQGHLEEAASAIQESLACVHGMSDDFWKNSALMEISAELAKQGRVKDALACAKGISNEYEKSRALEDISIELVLQGNAEESFACAREITYDRGKISAFKVISIELAKQGYLKESLNCIDEISSEYWKSSALKEISIELAKKGRVEEAISNSRGISVESERSSARKNINAELAKQGHVEEAASFLQESLSSYLVISSEKWRSSALKDISTELAKQGHVQEALACAHGISIEYWKSSALKDISTELAKHAQVEESIACARGISVESEKCSALAETSTELAMHCHLEAAASAMQESIDCAHVISDNYSKSSALKDISIELAKQGYLEKSLAFVNKISSEYWKSSALKDISTELAKQGHEVEAASAMQKSLDSARMISYECGKSEALMDISTQLAKQGRVEESSSAMQESLACARGISDESEKSFALKEISTELAKQGNMEDAEIVALEIPQISWRQNCWKEIGKTAWKLALKGVQTFKSDEARLFYLRGWSKQVAAENVTAECVAVSLPFIIRDSESIENLLQNHALHGIFFSNIGCERINRLNRTLNIQWALDIAAQFPKTETKSRLSTNLESWLHEIADEDDREQIELWAKQVAKGKITEEEFGERVNEL
jgi:tetratricopeptide (TPR) repeat protein